MTVFYRRLVENKKKIQRPHSNSGLCAAHVYDVKEDSIHSVRSEPGTYPSNTSTAK